MSKPSLQAIIKDFMHTAKGVHSDKIGKIVFRKQNEAMAAHIKALNEAIQDHPELRGYAFHEFQTANSELIVTGDCDKCCFPDRDPPCGCC